MSQPPPRETQLAVSWDSRQRPADQPDYKYTLSLPVPVKRVRRIGLGSIQLGDGRYSFDNASHIGICEPLEIPPHCTVEIEETDRTPGKVTLTRNYTILLPPSLNRVMSVTRDGEGLDVIRLTHLSGLYFALRYYPLVGLRVRLVGGHYFDTGPVLSANTIVLNRGPESYTYAPTYLTTLRPLGNDAERHVGPGYSSFVAADRPLPHELVKMVNAALDDLNTIPDATGSVVAIQWIDRGRLRVTTAAPHSLRVGESVQLAGFEGRYMVANGSHVVVEVGASGSSPIAGVMVNGSSLDVEFDISPLDTEAVYVWDTTLPDTPFSAGSGYRCARRMRSRVEVSLSTGRLTAYNKSGTSTATGTGMGSRTGTTTNVLLRACGFTNLLGVVGSIPFASEPAGALPAPHTSLAPLQYNAYLREGNFTPVDISKLMSFSMNPLLFNARAPAHRTLTVLLPSGLPYPVVIPRGMYSPAALAILLDAKLRPPPSCISVSYDPATRCLTLAHTKQAVFGLMLTGDTNVATAAYLGFEPRDFWGYAAYTASFPCVSPGNLPKNIYELGWNVARRRVAVSATSVQTHLCVSGFFNPPATTQITLALLDSAARFCAGDILTLTCPWVSARVGTISNTTPLVVSTGTLPVELRTMDTVSIQQVQGCTQANGIWAVRVLSATSFELVGSSAGAVAYSGGGIIMSMHVYRDSEFRASPLLTAVVAAPDAVTVAYWGAEGINFPNAEYVVVHPTASFLSQLGAGTADRAAGIPDVLNNGSLALQIVSAHRPQFQLNFAEPMAMGMQLGFPPMLHPPLWKNIDNYYSAPLSWALEPAPYIFMMLTPPVQAGHGTLNLHSMMLHPQADDPAAAEKALTRPFAKLHVGASSPGFHTITEQLNYLILRPPQNLNRLMVEFRNPDGSWASFNGRPHTFTLILTYENTQVDA